MPEVTRSVTERVGRGLDDIGPQATDAQVRAAWTAVAQLHSAGISHGGISPERVRVVDDEARLSDLARAEVSPTRDAQLIDQAQLLVATAMAVGPERAVSVAADAVGLDELAAMSSFVQPAALTVPLRMAADAAGVDIDDLRATVIARTQQDPPELQRLRRLSVGRVLLLLMVVIATSALLSSIADIGLDTIIDAMREASGPLLLLAFVIGLTPRVANAVGLSAVGAVEDPPRPADGTAVRDHVRQPGDAVDGGPRCGQHPVLPTQWCACGFGCFARCARQRDGLRRADHPDRDDPRIWPRITRARHRRQPVRRHAHSSARSSSRSHSWWPSR